MNSVFFTSNTDDWKTPSHIYKFFMDCGWKDCFPYKSLNDEFENQYMHQYLFVNPPFSKINKVVDWIYDQYENQCVIALLIPARIDTKWFHRLLDLYPFIYFIKGRLKYNDSNSAPFPTLLLIISKSQKKMFNWSTIESGDFHI